MSLFSITAPLLSGLALELVLSPSVLPASPLPSCQLALSSSDERVWSSLQQPSSGGIAINVKLTRLEPPTLGIKRFCNGESIHSKLVITVRMLKNYSMISAKNELPMSVLPDVKAECCSGALLASFADVQPNPSKG